MLVSVEAKLDQIENSTCTILLVEDNESLANAMSGLLRMRGFEVLQAQNAADAFQLSLCYNGQIHLLLIDAVLPQVSGIDLAGLLLTQRPDLRVLFMSGYTEEELHRNGLLAPGFAFIQKPASVQEIIGRIQTLLSDPASSLRKQ
jgi:two-component system, cell cycle sensor histidine kinase and response regulator CckA